MKEYWKTSDGREILYKDLEDDHLKNIIADGYRNPKIIEEAKKRKFSIPEREIDKVTDKDIAVYVESFASCAISGNKYAEIMIGYWRTDPQKFLFHLNQLLERKKILNNKEEGDMNELA